MCSRCASLLLRPRREELVEYSGPHPHSCLIVPQRLYYHRMPARTNKSNPKYRQIFDRLAREIASGKYAAGQKLPSEAMLVRQLGASRITVGRAVRELKDHG